MIISTLSTSTETVNYPGTKLVGVAFKLRKKIKNSPSCGHVLQKTWNLAISLCCFAEDGKEMYRNVKRTCRVIVFAHSTYCFVVLSLSSPSSLLMLPIYQRFLLCSQFLPVIIQLLIVFPVILPPFLSNEWHVFVVTWYLIILVLVLVIASMSTGQENSGYVDKFLR